MAGKKMLFSTFGKVLLLAALWPVQALAVPTCESTYSRRTDYIHTSAQILSTGVTISALRDLPIGSVLFRQYIQPVNMSSGVRNCTLSSPDLETEKIYYSAYWEPDGALPAVSGQYNGGNVYETGVPGIGMTVGSNKNALLNTLPFRNNFYTTVGEGNAMAASTRMIGSDGLEVLLVKTGNIAAGTWNVPINYPPIVYYVKYEANLLNPPTQAPFTDYGYRLTISGSVNVVAGTCQTPDINVPMGTHSINRQTQTTEWVNFNLQLNNCPPMYGRYNRKSPDTYSTAMISWVDNTANSSGEIVKSIGKPDTPNDISFRLNPVSGYQTLAAGGSCAALTSDSDTAKGMCIEIQNNASENILTNSQANILTDANLALQQTTASYAIPLKARYARNTESVLTGGKANAAVEFTINYQ